MKDDPEYRVPFRCLAVLVLAASALMLVVGPWPLKSLPADTFILLDGAWRLHGGQVPHRDYISPVGILPQAVVGLGMLVFGPTVHALAQGPALVMPVIFVWCWALARRRLSCGFACLVTALTVFLWAGPTPQGMPLGSSGYAMFYNRMAWSFFLLLALECLFRPTREGWRGRSGLEAGLSGIATALLLFSKPNYLLAGVGLLILGMLAHRENRGARILHHLIGILTACLLAILVLGWDPASQLRDLSALSRCHPLAEKIDLLGDALWTHESLQLFFALWAVLSVLVMRRPAEPGSTRWDILLLPAGAVILGVIVITGNTTHRNSTVPVVGLGLLSLRECLCQHLPERNDRMSRGAMAFLTSVTILHWAIPSVLDVGMLVRAASLSSATPDSPGGPTRLKNPRLRDLLFLPLTRRTRLETLGAGILYREEQFPEYDAVEYARELADGPELLEGHADGTTGLVVLSFVDPFTFALDWPPARGTALFWHEGRTVCPENLPAPEKVFHEARWVLAETGRMDSTARFLQEAYASTLDRDFEERARSGYWILYRRVRDGSSPETVQHQIEVGGEELPLVEGRDLVEGHPPDHRQDRGAEHDPRIAGRGTVAKLAGLDPSREDLPQELHGDTQSFPMIVVHQVGESTPFGDEDPDHRAPRR